MWILQANAWMASVSGETEKSIVKTMNYLSPTRSFCDFQWAMCQCGNVNKISALQLSEVQLALSMALLDPFSG